MTNIQNTKKAIYFCPNCKAKKLLKIGRYWCKCDPKYEAYQMTEYSNIKMAKEILASFSFK